eukprot:TRINITY_DN12295_c0_g1_i1.p1 TRINITY_DN12295_c0_g1~~TRINITY_DN12295_c0_g1_i1.p1  ORF type:complete len:171 (+),score=31.98 TRINITY_DN12295_c0_g1_i1:71-514(+)
MDTPLQRSIPPTEKTIAATHLISQIQQARYRHSRVVEEAEDEYSAKHCYMPDVVTTVESFGLQAVGVEEVVATQKAIREGLGPHRSALNRLTVDIVDDTHAKSTDEAFIYSTVNGGLLSILTNNLTWVLSDGEWKIASITTHQEWGL